MNPHIILYGLRSLNIICKYLQLKRQMLTRYLYWISRIFSVVVPIGQIVHHIRGVKRIPQITPIAVAVSIKTKIVKPILLISPFGITHIISPINEPIIKAHKKNLNPFLCIMAGRLSEKKANGRVTNPRNEPLGHILAQLILP